jgi:hypothetical protein
MRFQFRILAGLLLAGLLIAQSAFADDNEHFRGCLTGTKDNYVLRSVDGNLYRLHSSDDIKDHVGQMVEVKGHVENKDRDKAAASQVAAARSAGVTIPTVGIDVVHIKGLAGSCSDMKADAGVAVAPGVNTSTTVTTTTTTTTPSAGVASGVASGVDNGVSGSVEQGIATESGKYQHYTGCLTGVKDNYVLRSDDGSLYRLHSDKDIHEHVNARVDVRGRIDNKDRDREAQVNAPVAAQVGVEVPRAGINVEDIKTISGACTVR